MNTSHTQQSLYEEETKTEDGKKKSHKRKSLAKFQRSMTKAGSKAKASIKKTKASTKAFGNKIKAMIKKNKSSSRKKKVSNDAMHCSQN